MLTVYKASAGSGKTYALAENYIILLLGIKRMDAAGELAGQAKYDLNLRPGGPVESRKLKIDNRHRAILAITFTRKATEEMKNRILDELQRLSEMPAPGASPKDDANYAADLMDLFGCTRAELAQASSLALRQLVFDYQNFHVSTIDAFFQRVLHTFARELDRQGDFSVELDDKQAMQRAVGSMLDEFNKTADLAGGAKPSTLEDWLYDYMLGLIDKGRKPNFFNRRGSAHTSLVDLVSKISNEGFKPYSAMMEEYLASDKLSLFAKDVEDFKASIVAQAKAIAAGIDPELYRGSRTGAAVELFKKFAAGTPLRSIDDFGDSAFVSSLCDATAPWDSVKSWKAPDAEKPRLKEAFEQAAALYQRYFAAQGLEPSITQLGLLKHSWGYLRKLAADDNLLLISDTNELLQRVIGEDETPFIYERMGVELRHFLIDEFQDTSQMQWGNLRPLVSNGVDDRHDSMVIGDEKQSIYRWRNSDSSILQTKLAEQFGGKMASKGTGPRENTNYRSSADVVKFNNTLFSIIAEGQGLPAYGNVVQNVCDSNKSRSGHVRFIAIEKQNRKPVLTDDEILEQMTAEIDRMTAEGKRDYKDIVVLVNTHKDGYKVVEYLVNKRPDIPVASDEALRLSMSFAVQLVISVLKIIDQEDSDTEHSAERKKYLTRGQVLMVLNRYQYYCNRGGLTRCEALDKAMEPLAGGPVADASLDELISEVRRRRPSSLVGLIEAVIAIQFPDKEMRDAHSAYLAGLQDAAMAFAEQSTGSLHAFLKWWDARSGQLSIGGSASDNKVRVMTIHKSKGLEFPCVLIPFCSWRLSWSRDPHVWTEGLTLRPIQGLDISNAPCVLPVTLGKHSRLPASPFLPDYEEEAAKTLVDTVNKTYVAFTRASSELIAWYQRDSILIGDLIDQALKKGLPTEVPYDGETLVDLRAGAGPEGYELGEPTVKTDEEIEKERQLRERAAKAMRVGYSAECRPDVLKITAIEDPRELERDNDDKEPLSPFAPKTPQQIEGIALHDIMANVIVPGDLPGAVARMAVRHRLGPEKAEEYAEMLDAFVRGPGARWFGTDCKAYVEQPVYVPGSDEVRRPDRVVLHPDGSVDVIDYKFTDEDDRVGDEAHLAQVGLYMRLMRQIWPGAQVRGYLCYPRVRQVVQVGSETVPNA